MLRIVLGSSPDEKLNMFAGEIKAFISSGKSVLALVPDQFSFEFDKALYSRLGAKDFNLCEVQSFKKISETLIARNGGRFGALMRQDEKIPLIYLAFKKIKSEKRLKAFEKSLDKPSFIGDISDILDSLIRSETSPQALFEASERISSSVGDKLRDIACIYSEYLVLLDKAGLRDESSTLSTGAVLAASEGFFKGKRVYIDRFDSYSSDELSLISCAVKDAESVSVSIALPSGERPRPGSFYSLCFDTQEKLVDIAKRLNSPVEYVDCGSFADLPQSLSQLRSCLLGKGRQQLVCDGGVNVISCASVYEEAEFAAAKILNLVSSGDYTYSDIAVITYDFSKYQTALESAFERYDIPYYMDSKQRASDMSVMLFAFAAIEAASSQKPDTDRIMKYVRSLFSEFSESETALIEDYCIRWNVDGDMWLESFTACEPGDDIEKIEALRLRIIEPLMKLKRSSLDADGRTVALSFNNFLKTCKVAETAKKIIDDCDDPDEKLESARLFKQLWNSLMSAVASVYNTVSDNKLSLRDFGELLRLSLSNTYVSNPPQKLSCTVVSDASRSVISSPKAAFVIGVNDGSFPPDTKKSGIFSGRDSELLLSEGLNFQPSELDRLSRERFNCFTALTCASKAVYILYSQCGVSGKAQRPALLLSKITKNLGISCVRADSFTEDFYSITPRAAYYRLLISGNGSESERAAIRQALMSYPDYKAKLESLENAKDFVHRLSPNVAKKLFAPGDINVTASRIDVYNKCAFEYFMRYGLCISPVRPMSVDPANRGSIMHYVFQNVLSRYGEAYENAADEDIKRLISELLISYENEFLGGDFGKSGKFRYEYRRLADACFEILVNIREEYKVSKFRPVKYEYSLTSENGESILTIPADNGLKINIRGVVDRIDIYKADNGSEYIRIIDYKTGDKQFRLEDIYNGLNLQLLLYMTALVEGKDVFFNSFIPAAVLYMKSGFLTCEQSGVPDGSDPEERFKLAAGQLRRSGLVLDDENIVSAMDENVSGMFVPVSRKKDGSYTSSSSVISKESFGLLRRFALQKVREFGEALAEGKIGALPCGRDKDHLVCSYCEYGSVCDRKKYMYKLITKDDAARLAEIISPEVNI